MVSAPRYSCAAHDTGSCAKWRCLPRSLSALSNAAMIMVGRAPGSGAHRAGRRGDGVEKAAWTVDARVARTQFDLGQDRRGLIKADLHKFPLADAPSQ